MKRSDYSRYQERQMTLGEVGMSVFRQTRGERFDEINEVLAKVTGNLTLRLRGIVEKSHAVTLLNLVEAKSQRPLREIKVTEAADEIYDSMPSLRKKVTVQTAGLDVFGNPNGPNRSIAITFDPESEELLRQERLNVLETLEEISPTTGIEYNWMRVWRPHLSLGRISLAQAKTFTQPHLDAMQGCLPEQVVLQAATIHNPSAKGGLPFRHLDRFHHQNQVDQEYA